MPPRDQNNVTPWITRDLHDMRTITNDSFKPIIITERTKINKVFDTYEKSTDPFNGESETKSQYKPLKIEKLFKHKSTYSSY